MGMGIGPLLGGYPLSDILVSLMHSESYCSLVCVCVCVCQQISPIGCLFVLKTLSPTQRAMKVKGFA